MSFDPIHIEIDGTLANPAVLAAVIAWAVILAAATIVVVRSDAGRRRSRLGLLAVLYLFTPVAQQLIVTFLYWSRNHRIAGVGLWGGPPFWLAPACGASVGLVAWAVGKRTSSPAA